MRQPIRFPSFSRLRLALLGLAAALTMLAFLPVRAQACNGYIYCTTWGWADGCCVSGGGYHGRQQRTCTDGVGHYCTEYRCTTGPCAI
ncbi:MAG TPA: hypothetical protein VGX68_24165 [Thermoanaerobaculia bacterium]|jgi:hypothetical protein|nr:hypothetical protein [Thermoanaerobaculia bacterium]